jgi:hypothetical protein
MEQTLSKKCGFRFQNRQIYGELQNGEESVCFV